MSNDFIEHIEGKHHAFLRMLLPELAQYVITLERVHGERYVELQQLRRLFSELHDELTEMMELEEGTVFPIMRQMEHGKAWEQDTEDGSHKQFGNLLPELKAKRARCLQLLQQIRETTANFALPADACPTHQLTYQLMQELEADLAQHIRLENRVLGSLALAE